MTAPPLVLAQLLLVVVLALSAVLKLRAPRSTRDAFGSLRLPEWLSSTPAPEALPYAELLLAALLLLGSGRIGLGAGVAAVAVFGAYLAVVVRALRFDESVTCSCFGRLGLGALSRTTVVRNGVLLLLALGALARAASGSSLLDGLGHLDAGSWAWLAMGLVATLLGWLVGFPGTTAGHDVPTTDEDYVRHPIPYGQLELPDGTTRSLREMARHGAVLLVFLSYGCAPCMRVVEQLPAFGEGNPEVSTAAVFQDLQRDRVATTDLGVPTLFDPRNGVASMFGSGTPSAVLLGADGMLAGGPVTGEREVLDLLADIAAELADSREAVA